MIALRIATPGPGEGARWARFWDRPHLARDAAEGETRRVVIDARGTIAGALSGRYDGPRRFVVHGLRAEPGHLAAPRALAAAAAALAPTVEVTLRSEALDRDLAAALAAVGFEPAVDTVCVERDLADLPPRDGRLALRRLPALGPRALRAAVAAAYDGTPNRHAPASADALLAQAAEHGLVERWGVAYLGAAPVGVLLPVLRAGRGSMGFVGLLPAYRGAGLGRALLALGLAELAAAGASRYADRTDLRNQPMWRTFAAAGCRFVGIEHTLIREVDDG